MSSDRKRWREFRQSTQTLAEGGIASTVARLLHMRLGEETDWGAEGNWIDDLLVDTFEISKHGRITINGNIVFGKGGTTRQWLARCEAVLDRRDRELVYRICFDDELQPHTEYPQRPRRMSIDPLWRFTFERGAL
jgi:hypothetical protein